MKRRAQREAFTRTELLVAVGVVFALLLAILLRLPGAGREARKAKTAAEIEAISSALAAYNNDEEVYPLGNTAGIDSALLGPPKGSYPLDPSIPGGPYQVASEALFAALSGKTHFSDAPAGRVKTYLVFPRAELRDDQPGAGPTFICDPWGYPFGYSTGDGKLSNTTVQILYPYNGTGLYDLWSTGGSTNDASTWITNWK